MQEVFKKGFQVIEKIEQTQLPALNFGAQLIADAFMQDKHFFVSGSGHSHTVAEEFYGRAGGLAFVIPILTSELTLTDHPQKSTYLERLSGYAEILAQLYGITSGDVVLIASNSGRNAYPVELALAAKKRGAKVIAITSLAHTKSVSARTKTKQRLCEVADVVIDNCGQPGDACLEVTGVATKMCPTSSMANAFIVQALSVGCAQILAQNKVEVPVFASANSDGNDAKNQFYFEKYTRLYTN